ncbi:hypothetical protein BG000_006928 [Podila horticola]|nr:hypothetical protein BG000_006928 [Podila horticola]
MNPPYEFAPASSPSTQKPFSRTINSPSVTHPDESPGSGRQRVKTEPSPRHLHTPHASSGWLGPYNESSPIPGSRSPRARLGHSPAATDTRGGGGGLSDRNYYDRNDASRIQGHGVQDTHKALGWQLESSSRPGSMSTSLGHVEGSGFRRREFDPRQGHDSSGFAGPLMEPSSSVQSLVESIDDDHVLKLTEMTKKRVEHNNPTQKRQRVVSLPTSEAAPAQFQPSEKTVQLSNSCKALMESKYSQLFQSIHAGHPVNRLQKLREILPKINPASIPRASLDQPRSKRPKSDKYRFVDKVEESSCIWDVDHMERKAQDKQSGLAKQPTLSSISEQRLDTLASSSASSSSVPVSSIEGPRYPVSTSTDSFVSETNPFFTSGDAVVPSIPVNNQSAMNAPFHEPPYEGDNHPNSTGVTPSSTFSSIGNPHQHSGSNVTSSSSIEPGPQTQKETTLDHKTSTSESLPTTIDQLQQQPQSLQPQQGLSRISTDEAHAKPYEYGEMMNVTHFTDDENTFAPPTIWPQGERMDDSQDESDATAPAATTPNKRSSLRRLTEKMWKRGTKTMPTIQGDPQSLGALQAKALVEGNKSLGKKLDPALAYLTGQPMRLSVSQPSSGRNSMEGSTRPKLSFSRVMSGTSSPVLEATKSPDIIGASSPRIGPMAPMDKAGILTPSGASSAAATGVVRSDKSPMLNPIRDRSPMLTPTPSYKADRSPLLIPASTFVGEELANNVAPINVDPTKLSMCFSSQLLVDVERIPKRLLPKLKERPELASIDWGSETVDLSGLWVSPEPMPTYDEYVGISSKMKATNLLPQHLENVDVLDIHLTIGIEETRDFRTKARARKWDMLELRVDNELDNGEKWIKEVQAWSKSKVEAVERYRQADLDAGEWLLDGGALVEEPEDETLEEGEGEEGEQEDEDEAEEGEDHSKPDEEQVRQAKESPNRRMPHIAPLETLKARKQVREMSLTLGRDLRGSMSSFHKSVTYGFKDNVDATRESIKEMAVYLQECRQRLKQLQEATGEQLREKEPVFKEIVDKFTMEWNESYFVRLKEVEDQIQVMNVKRIENPWMDMLLIMLSWVIRGLFYIVEGVTIMIIIGRHAWGQAKKGYQVVRKTQIEQGEDMQRSGLGVVGEVPVDSPRGPKDDGAREMNTKENGHGHEDGSQSKLVGAW